jgi:hypothetical protein
MAGPEWRRSVLRRVEWTRSPVQRLPSWRRLLTNRTPGARLQVFVRAVVSEPFLSTYNASGGAVVWGATDIVSRGRPARSEFPLPAVSERHPVLRRQRGDDPGAAARNRRI